MRTERPAFPTCEGRYVFRQTDHSGLLHASVYNAETLMFMYGVNDGKACNRTVGDSDNFAWS